MGSPSRLIRFHNLHVVCMYLYVLVMIIVDLLVLVPSKEFHARESATASAPSETKCDQPTTGLESNPNSDPVVLCSMNRQGTSSNHMTKEHCIAPSGKNISARVAPRCRWTLFNKKCDAGSELYFSR